jgi:hypothetical protein
MRKKILRTGAYFISLLLSALFISTNTRAQKAVPSKIKYSEYSIKIISAPGNSYGYEISKDNSIIIRQPNIPGMPGNKGFKLKADAQKVASLAVSKLTHGIMPPTIEKKEMDKLLINY